VNILTRRRILTVTVCVGAGVLLALFLLGRPTALEAPTQTLTAIQSGPASYAPGVPGAPTQSDAAASIVLSAEDEAVIEELRARFATRMESPHARIKLLEQLLSYLMSRYPEDWQQRLGVFLRSLFPQQALGLESEFHKLMQHNEWLRTHRQELLQLPLAERRQQLWDARRAAFGADAELIWAAERKNEIVQDTLLQLEDAGHLTVEEKFSRYLASVEQAYGEQSAGLVQQRQTELMHRFLNVDSVQTDLQAQTAEQRQASLRAMRSAMGMDAAALERWSAVDRERDQAWERGQNYERERARIFAEYQGRERERRLAELRKDIFAEHAQLIAEEEDAGFYRYQGTRRIGRE
jgi:hypothetical protein